jgi:hypothetical protein
VTAAKAKGAPQRLRGARKRIENAELSSQDFSLLQHENSN